MLGALVSIGTLFAFVIVSLGVIVLRRTRPDLPRPFRMPWVPVLPLLSAAVSLVLMLGLPRATWERLIIWMVIGDRLLLRVWLSAAQYGGEKQKGSSRVLKNVMLTHDFLFPRGDSSNEINAHPFAIDSARHARGCTARLRQRTRL